jgi:adenylate cyclase
MPRLTIIGPEGRQEFDLLPHNTLGRHPNNTMQVLDRIVSKEHAHIDLVDGRYMLRDLGSLNGTYVNGERVGERVLNPGDELTMGSTKIIFDAEGAAARSRPSGGSNPSVPTVGMGVPPSPGHYSPSMPQAPAWQQPVAPAPSFPTSPLGGAPAPSFQTSPLSAEALAGAGLVGGSVAANLSQSIAKAAKPISNVTIAPGMVESHIRTRLGMEQNFLPEKLVADHDALRRDYEKLRVSYELARQIGNELDIQKVLDRILAAAFQLLAADRGIILLADESGEQLPRALRTRSGQVNASEPVQISKTLVDQVRSTKEAVLSSDAMVDNRFKGAHSMIMQGIRSSMAVPLLHSGALLGIMILDSQIATNAFTEKDLQMFQNIANQAAMAVQNSLFARKLEQEAVTRERFQRLLSPAIAQQVIDGKVEITKGGEARQTTVLFSDIRGFTAMSEKEDPQIIVDMVNEYFELMVEVIFKYEGTLDKFVGDEIMALFGAPVGHSDDPIRAVRTAIEMLDVLRQLNQLRVSRGEPEILIGIGVNTGNVVAGYIGSSKALEYTVIGDTVNTGARLCSYAKAGEIIISQATYERLNGEFEVIPLPDAKVKNKSEMLKIYNVIGERHAAGTDRTRPA